MKGLKVQDEKQDMDKEDIDVVLNEYYENTCGMSFKSFFESKTSIAIEELRDFDFSALEEMKHLDFSGITFIGCKFGAIVESNFKSCQFVKSQFLGDVKFCNFEEVSFVKCNEANGIQKFGNIFSYSNPFLNPGAGKFNCVLENGNIVYIHNKLEDVSMMDKDMLHWSMKDKYNNLNAEALQIVAEAKNLGFKIPDIKDEAMIWVSCKDKIYTSDILADIADGIKLQKLIDAKQQELKSHQSSLSNIESQISSMRQEQVARVKRAGLVDFVIAGLNVFSYKFPLDIFIKNQPQACNFVELLRSSIKLKASFLSLEVLLIGIVTFAYVSQNKSHKETIIARDGKQREVTELKSRISSYNDQKEAKTFINNNTFVEIENSTRTKVNRSHVLRAIAKSI